MNFKNKLNAIKIVLGLEVALESAKLVDGTVVEAEIFEPGYPLFITNEDGTKSPAPAGEHVLEDGTKVVVDEMGAIAEITKPDAESESEESPEVKIEVEAAAVVEEEVKIETPISEEFKETIKALALVVEEVAKEVAEIKTEMKSMKEKYEKFSATPAANRFPSVTNANSETVSPLDAKIALLNELKGEKFFRAK